jgi:hypothetical protein
LRRARELERQGRAVAGRQEVWFSAAPSAKSPPPPLRRWEAAREPVHLRLALSQVGKEAARRGTQESFRLSLESLTKGGGGASDGFASPY